MTKPNIWNVRLEKTHIKVLSLEKMLKLFETMSASLLFSVLIWSWKRLLCFRTSRLISLVIHKISLSKPFKRNIFEMRWFIDDQSIVFLK